MGNTVSVPPRGAGAQPPTSPIVSFVPMIVVIGILYFLIIRPQQQQAKAHRTLVDNLKVGDRVITQGGIHGIVKKIKGAVIEVRIGSSIENGSPTIVDVNRTAIAQVAQASSNGTPSSISGEISA